MKLCFSKASPYVRKVSVVLIETELDDGVEKITSNVWDPESEISNYNPLGKVPTLILDDTTVLYDSPVICEYLDSLHDGEKLFPLSSTNRWKALRLQALGDGMIDAGIIALLESRRSKELINKKWIKRQILVASRVLDNLESELEDLQNGFNIGHISIACSLGWFDFRFSDFEWRKDHPGLADWFEIISDRSSMIKTMPES
jgi:glutathione S-transferase